MRFRAAALLLFAGGLAAGASAQQARRTSPTVAREAAESNGKTPAGRRYESALESSLDRWLRKALERCVKGIAKEQAVSFEAFVRVGGSGEAQEVVFDPETAVARCIEPEFQSAKYPEPPQSPWWVRVEIGLR